MEKYTQEDFETNVHLEPQDEYICSKCGEIVGLVIDGMCIKCSNNNQGAKQ